MKVDREKATGPAEVAPGPSPEAVEALRQARETLATASAARERAGEALAAVVERLDKAHAALARAEGARPITPESMADAANARLEIEAAEAERQAAVAAEEATEVEVRGAKRAVQEAEFEVALEALPAERDLLRARLAEGYAALAAEVEAFAAKARALAARAPEPWQAHRARDAAGLLAFSEGIEWNPLAALTAAEARAASEVAQRRAEQDQYARWAGGGGGGLPSPGGAHTGLLAPSSVPERPLTEAEQFADDLRRAEISRKLNEAPRPDRSWDYDPLQRR